MGALIFLNCVKKFSFLGAKSVHRLQISDTLNVAILLSTGLAGHINYVIGCDSLQGLADTTF